MYEWIKADIIETISEFQRNPEIQSSWKEPVIGYASAGDPLFDKLKSVASPTHHTPRELLGKAQTVIAYFLPFVDSITRSNRAKGLASQSWAKAYLETNQLIVSINQHLAHSFHRRGYNSVVLPPTHNFDADKLLSDWSHKHIAYIAGLGKFGLHHMLITEKGCCGRLGSIVVDVEIEPTSQANEDACLYKYNQSCTNCVKRCEAGALTENGFDRHECYKVCLDNADKYKALGLADVCGKCMSMVPCSFINPVRKLLISPQK